MRHAGGPICRPFVTGSASGPDDFFDILDIIDSYVAAGSRLPGIILHTEIVIDGYWVAVGTYGEIQGARLKDPNHMNILSVVFRVQKALQARSISQAKCTCSPHGRCIGSLAHCYTSI